MKKILIVSNGYGEDLIATYLIKSLKKQSPRSIIKALPLVGDGLSYIDAGIKPLSNQKILPSGGFIRSPKAFIQDLFHGLITQAIKNIVILKRLSNKFDLIISVGDVYCLILCSLFNKKPRYFLPTAKSDYFMPHSNIEILLIKKLSRQVFTRDELTANSLRKAKINAHFLGNIMFDAIEFSDQNYNLNTTDYVFGLLPGSRKEALLNLKKLCTLVLDISKTMKNTKFILAKANSLSLEEIKNNLPKEWQVCGDIKLENITTGTAIILAKKFGDVLKESDLILGLAGTANEQAVYFGHTVIAFKGAGEQTTKKRFVEQKKLLGEKLIFIDENNISKLTEKIILISKNVIKPSAIKNSFSASENIAKEILKGTQIN